MNLSAVFSLVIAYLWDAILFYGQTPQGEIQLAAILAALEGSIVSTPATSQKSPAWMDSGANKPTAKPETEAERRARVAAS